MIEAFTNRIRYEALVLACKGLRHPNRRTTYLGGRSETRCPCGYINISDRGFSVGKL